MPRSRRTATRPARAILVCVVALATCLLSACGSSTSTPGTAAAIDGSSDTGAFPTTVSTKFGDVKIPEAPRRVVALGWGDAATALALGVQPVGASDWLAFGGNGLGPWATKKYTKKPTIIGTLEPSYEKIAALHPDLILDVKSSGDQKRYDLLSKIAPTIGVPKGGDSYVTGMPTQVKMIAKALGKQRKGAALLSAISKDFAQAAAAHPEFKGKTITVSALSGGGWGAYITKTDRVKFMKRLGFRSSPTIDALKPEGFSVPLSTEQLRKLNADLVVTTLIGKPASAVTDNPAYQHIPAVAKGHYLVLGDTAVTHAYSANTVQSVPYAIKKLVPMLAAKVTK